MPAQNPQPHGDPSRAAEEIDSLQHDRMWGTYPWQRAWKYPLAPRASGQMDDTGSRHGGTEKEKRPCAS